MAKQEEGFTSSACKYRNMCVLGTKGRFQAGWQKWITLILHPMVIPFLIKDYCEYNRSQHKWE